MQKCIIYHIFSHMELIVTSWSRFLHTDPRAHCKDDWNPTSADTQLESLQDQPRATQG